MKAIRERVHFEPQADACFTCPILGEKMKSADGEAIQLTRDQLIDLVADVVRNMEVV